MLAGAARAFDPWTEPARYQLVYQVDLSALPPGSIRVWLPTPLEGFDQHLVDLEVTAPLPHRETWDGRGNRMLYLEGPSPPAGSPPLRARFDVVREPGGGLPDREIVKGSPDDPSRYLAGQRRIPLSGVVAELGRQVAGGQPTDVEKVRAIYGYVVRTMRYAKDGRGWGQGDAVWACGSKYGNCTDFHSVFLGMARSQGVPARFVMGFPIPAESDSGAVEAYHCWAQAYEAGRGWIPLDASEARKRDRIDDYFGRLPSDRVAFSQGRDLVLAPPQRGEALNYFIHPYVEVDGRAADTPPWTLRFRRVPMRAAPGTAR